MSFHKLSMVGHVEEPDSICSSHLLFKIGRSCDSPPTEEWAPGPCAHCECTPRMSYLLGVSAPSGPHNSIFGPGMVAGGMLAYLK